MSFSKSDINYTLARLARDHGVTLQAAALERLTNEFVNALENEPQEQNYKVSLEFEFEASSPELAVRQFVELVASDGLEWNYFTTDEDGKITQVDTYGWGLTNTKP